jgi:hypothetical protein
MSVRPLNSKTTQIQTYQTRKRSEDSNCQNPSLPPSDQSQPWPYLAEAEAAAAAASSPFLPSFPRGEEMEAGPDGEQTEGTIWSDPWRIYLAALAGRVRWTRRRHAEWWARDDMISRRVNGAPPRSRPHTWRRWLGHTGARVVVVDSPVGARDSLGVG